MMTRQLIVITAQPVSYQAATNFEIVKASSSNMATNDGNSSGIALLAQLDTFSINPVIDTWLTTPPCLLPKQFLLMTPQNKICYKITEESELICRVCCPVSRTFSMHAQDSTGKIIFSIKRKSHCSAGTFGCCHACSNGQQMASVELGNGSEIGSIVEAKNCFTNVYNVYDTLSSSVDGTISPPVLRIVGPSCLPLNCCSSCCKDVTFAILDKERNTVGQINFLWAGLKMHCFAPTDPYSIKLNGVIDIRLKTLIIGAVFLIDFRHFEIGRLRKLTRNTTCCFPCAYYIRNIPETPKNQNN